MPVEPFPRTPLTYRDLLAPAMRITDEAEAAAYMTEAVAWMVDVHKETPERATEIMRGNLGYYAGHYDHETRARVGRLFACAHPVFGAIAEKGVPTVGEAFGAGVALGREVRDAR